MADNSGGGGTTVLALFVGALLVAVVVLGLFMFNGRMGGNSSVPAHITMNVKPPAAPTHP